MAGTARRIKKRLERRVIEQEEDQLAADQPLLAMLAAASVRSRIATGPEAGRPWRRLGDQVVPIETEQESGASSKTDLPERCVRQGGMSLHADVAVPARDRMRLERLCRYILRPALCLDRLEALPSGMLSYQLKNRWRDGTTHILMERRELLERLAPLIPPPRAHQVRYHGILAPCAAGRSVVVPNGIKSTAAASDDERSRATSDRSTTAGAIHPGTAPDQNPRPTMVLRAGTRTATGVGNDINAVRSDAAPLQTTEGAHGPKVARSQVEQPSRTSAVLRTRRLSWSELLKRVFGIEALRCPRCGDTMRVMATITDPAVAQRILACLQLPPRAPPLATASTTAEVEFEPTLELLGHDFEPPLPEFDFDQRPRNDGSGNSEAET
jgi:hypothetical protein